MARPSTSEHPLAVVRRALGLSQSEMAENLGVSPSYVNAIECGARKVSKKMEGILLTRYGVTPDHLDPDNRDRLKDGEALSKFLLLWQTEAAPRLNKRAHHHVTFLIPKLQELVSAAQEQNKAAALLFQFDQWMDEIRSDMKLGMGVARIRAGKTAVERDCYVGNPRKNNPVIQYLLKNAPSPLQAEYLGKELEALPKAKDGRTLPSNVVMMYEIPDGAEEFLWPGVAVVTLGPLLPEEEEYRRAKEAERALAPKTSKPRKAAPRPGKK